MIRILCILFRKEVQFMVVIYATLIIKGLKTVGEVPATLRDQVKQMLNDLDCPELAK